MNLQTIGMWQIIAGAVCWGTLGILGSQLNRAGFAGQDVAAFRIVIAALVLTAALPWFWPLLRTLNLRRLPVLALQSAIGMLGMSLCYFAAVSRVGSSLAVALLYTAPVWSLLFARLLLGEGITRRSALLTLVAALGVALTMTGTASANLTGILFGLGSGICYALYGVLGKRAMLGNPPMLVFFCSITISALILVLLPQTHQAFARLGGQAWPVWLSAVSLAVVGTIGASALFMKGLQKMPATRASVFTVFEPFTAVLLAAVLLGERLGAWQYVGVVLIISVAVLNAAPAKTRQIR